MATVTTIIDSYGTPGVNCDFTTIDDWALYVSGQSNPDQVGILRGEHSDPSINLSAFSGFSVPTTQDACPRLIADPCWQAGYTDYGTAVPFDAPHLYYLTLLGSFAPGNLRHFKLQGLQAHYLQISFSARGLANVGIWLDSVCVGGLAQITGNSSGLETSGTAVRVLCTNCLFIGDNSSACFYFDAYLSAGSLNVAFLHSVIAKGAYLYVNGNSNLSVQVINSVQMAKEDSGLHTTAPALTVAGNASYPPSEYPDQLSPVFTIQNPEENPGVFANSTYYYSDYRLPAGSPLIDLGVTPSVPGWDLTGLKDVAGTARPRGGGYDIGLYEYPSLALDSSSLLLCF